PAAVLPAAEMVRARREKRPSRPGRRDGTGARWLCVGRMAPNKAIEDVLMALVVARSSTDPRATLEVVGKPVVATYTDALQRFVADLGLHDVVTFRGHATDEELSAAYVGAD